MKKRSIIIAGTLLLGGVFALAHFSSSLKTGPKYLYPNYDLTPGMVNPDITQGNISQTICNTGNWSTKSIRPPASYTNALKVKQLKNGYAWMGDVNPANYEMDHLISLELGGAPMNERNLWAEPYHTNIDGKEIGAKTKDMVENELHKEICSGKLTLKQAQDIIVKDWYAFYLKMLKKDSLLGEMDIDNDDE